MSVCVCVEDEEEEGELCRGGGGGKVTTGGEGQCSTDWMRLCWAWGRGDETEDRREVASW